MFDIKSFYEAKDVADAINALVKNPDAEIISGGTRSDSCQGGKGCRKIRCIHP